MKYGVLLLNFSRRVCHKYLHRAKIELRARCENKIAPVIFMYQIGIKLNRYTASCLVNVINAHINWLRACHVANAYGGNSKYKL